MPSTLEPQQVPLDGRLPWWPYSKHLSQNLLKEVILLPPPFPFSHIVPPFHGNISESILILIGKIMSWLMSGKWIPCAYKTYGTKWLLRGDHPQDPDKQVFCSLWQELMLSIGPPDPGMGAPSTLHDQQWLCPADTAAPWVVGQKGSSWRSCTFHVLSPTQVTSTTPTYLGLM